jgi:hypothetical protein
VTHETNRSFTLVGPFWSDIGPQSATVNLAPLFFHWHDRTHTRNGVVPFFFQESGPDYTTLATPLFVYARDHAESTVITPLYQNHRGLTSFDSVLPLFFYSRSPRLGQSTVVVFPFMFNTSSPTGYAWGAFPFAARFREYGRYDTVVTPLFAHSEIPERHSTFTWIFPTIHRETSPDSSLLNIYPLVWSAHGRGWHHRVFFPLYWDIGSRELRREITIVAPLFGRVRNGDDMTQWSFPNHVYWESRHDGFRAFGWDNFPFAQYGEPRRGDFYWSAFEGLVGYRRQGSYEQLRLFWIPIDLRGSRGSQGGGSQQARGGRAGDVLLDM